MSYAIVHFQVDDSVEAVPINWILNNGKQCYFPEAVNKSVRQKIRKGEPYDPSWNCFDCRVIKHYDNYRDARDNVTLALVTSDLSGSEAQNRKKPTAPPSLPSHPLANEVINEGFEVNRDLDISERDQDVDGTASVPSLVLSEGITPGNSSRAEPQPSNVEIVVVGGMEAFQQDVLSKLQQMQDVQNSHTELLNAILGSLKQKDTVDEGKHEFPHGMFPMKSMDSVVQLNALVREIDSARKELIRCMTSCGGGTMDDAVKLILKFLMTDDLLSAHCCKGHGSKKKRFLEYESLVQCMLGSLQRNARVLSQATMDNLEQAISKGLKQAMDRLTQQRKQEERLQSRITN